MLKDISKWSAFALWVLGGIVATQGLPNRASAQEALPWFSLVGDNFCLDVRGASVDIRAGLIIFECHGMGNQLFYQDYDESGEWFSLRAAHSNKCVDVRGASTADGAQIIQWECNGQDNQLFHMIYPSDDPLAHSLQAKHSEKCLDVRGASGWGNGTEVIQWPCHGGVNQLWY